VNERGGEKSRQEREIPERERGPAERQACAENVRKVERGAGTGRNDKRTKVLENAESRNPVNENASSE